MTVIDHGQRAHSKLGPSAAHRWLECTASVRLALYAENRSTVFALEGTAAHEFNEFIISNDHDPEDWQGGVIHLKPGKGQSPFYKFSDRNLPEVDGWDTWEITAEMVEGCQLMMDVIAEYYNPKQGDLLMLETRLDMTWVHPALFGTGDVLIYKKKTKHLIVLDYKYGRGVAVDVVDNPQLLTYAVGASALFADKGIKLITSVVVQPRAYHIDGPVRRQDVDPVDLAIFEGHLADKAAETDEGGKLVAGEHCKWCPVAHACVALREHVAEVTGVDMDVLIGLKRPLVESDMPKPIRMTRQQLGRLVLSVPVLEGFLKRIMQFAHNLGLEGNPPPGTKMVDKRAYRKFVIGEDDVELILEGEGYDTDEIYRDPKMKSLAQIEKLVGKKDFHKLFEGKYKKQSTGYVLAPVDDRREGVKMDNSDAFGAVDDD